MPNLFSPKTRQTIQKYFITYPKSGETSRQAFYESIFKIDQSEKFICCQEHHKDGSNHLHLAVILKQDCQECPTHVWKRIESTYPDSYKRIQLAPMKGQWDKQSYLLKEDMTPYTLGELPKEKYVKLSPKQKNIIKTWNTDFRDDENFEKVTNWETMQKILDQIKLEIIETEKIRTTQQHPPIFIC